MAIAFPISFWVQDETPASSTYKYFPCPGGPAGLSDLYIDATTHPARHLTIANNNPGEAWCYTRGEEPEEAPITEGLTYDTSYDPREGCPELCTVFPITSCDGAYTLYTTNSNVMNAAVNTFTIVGFEEQCFQGEMPIVLPNDVVLQITPLVFNEIYTPVAEMGCDCCDEGLYPNRWKYALCSEYGSPPLVPSTVAVEVPNPDGTTIPADTIVVDISGTFYCYSNKITTCTPVTAEYTPYEGEVSDCESCFAEHSGAVGEEKWIYTSCTECPDIVSTEPLHWEGIQSLWVSCCLYNIPESKINTTEEDTGWTVDQVAGLANPCEEPNFSCLEWQICEGMEGPTTLRTDLECCTDSELDLYVGITANNFSGVGVGGEAINPISCYTLLGPSIQMVISDCEGIQIQTCGEVPCVE